MIIYSEDVGEHGVPATADAENAQSAAQWNDIAEELLERNGKSMSISR
jgi:hypothetical protein